VQIKRVIPYIETPAQLQIQSTLKQNNLKAQCILEKKTENGIKIVNINKLKAYLSKIDDIKSTDSTNRTICGKSRSDKSDKI
jgi:hypothetical protein